MKGERPHTHCWHVVGYLLTPMSGVASTIEVCCHCGRQRYQLQQSFLLIDWNEDDHGEYVVSPEKTEGANPYFYPHKRRVGERVLPCSSSDPIDSDAGDRTVAKWLR